MTQRRVPVRDTLLIVLIPAAALLMIGIAAAEASAATHGWVSFRAALAAGFVPAVVATIVRARAAIVAGFAIGGLALVVLLGASSGALLRFWPGLVANYVRLRREEWPA